MTCSRCPGDGFPGRLGHAATALAVRRSTSHRQGDVAAAVPALGTVVPAVRMECGTSRGGDRPALRETAHLRADRLVRREDERPAPRRGPVSSVVRGPGRTGALALRAIGLQLRRCPGSALLPGCRRRGRGPHDDAFRRPSPRRPALGRATDVLRSGRGAESRVRTARPGEPHLRRRGHVSNGAVAHRRSRPFHGRRPPHRRRGIRRPHHSRSPIDGFVGTAVPDLREEAPRVRPGTPTSRNTCGRRATRS